jgi:short subunit dehydrogenase-like uncharacterized protein
MSTRKRSVAAPAKSSSRAARQSAVASAGAPAVKARKKPAAKAAAGSRSAAPARGAAREPAARGAARKPLDLVLLGATGFTGRQAVRALLRQRPEARWAVAGRDARRLQALVDELLTAGARPPQIIVADTSDPASLRAMARPAKVVLNLAGPYHAGGDAVVAACIAERCHYLDLTGETFWMQRLVREQHDAAARAGVKIIPCAGYEALPFDVAVWWAARQLRRHAAEPCAEVKIGVTVTGRPTADPRDLVSGGTAASVLALLEHDRSDCLRDMACLLPPGAADHDAVARRNALQWLPQYDRDLDSVLAPTLPGPFINPPVVLRGVALANDAALFAPGFRYREGTPMARLLPGGGRWLPQAGSHALQWTMAAALAAPLANLSATVTGPLRFQRQALRTLLQRLSPRPGSGPSERALDRIGYELEVVARGAQGARFRGRVVAQGHPGYRSTPEMAVCVALGLAEGTLGRTPQAGVLPPAMALGVDAVQALAAAGVEFLAAS